jgi:hypothetical protein
MDELPTSNKKEVFELITLKKAHLIIYISIAILTPIGSAYTAYQSAIKGLDKETIERKMIEMKLENEKMFIKKDEFSRFEQKLNDIAEGVAELRGRLNKG